MSFFHELRYAVRSLARQPSVTAVAVTTLALGLGLNTAVFAVAYGILWRPLPYPESDRLVTITTRFGDGDGGGIRLNTFSAWVDRLRTAHLSGYQTTERSLRGAGPARIVSVTSVTEDFFSVLGLPAAQGVAPPLPPGDPRAVISAPLARRMETSGAPAVGQTVTIGDRRYDVTAVMPATFAFPSTEVDAWIAVPPPPVANTGSGSYQLIGRLSEGATRAQAGEDADRVVRNINSAEWNATVRTLESLLLDDTRPAIQVSLAAAVLVLVVACASTTTLMIGRTVGRGHEFAVRRALGAGAGRLIHAAVVEGLVIAGSGLAVGLVLAWAGLRVFTSRAGGVLPRLTEIGLDLPSMLVATGLTVAVALVCGGVSAVGAMRPRGAALLRGTVLRDTPITRRLRAALVAAQLAMAIVLLTGAGLLARSVSALLAQNAGFRSERVLTARLMLGDSRFLDDASQTGFVDRLLARVRALPTVEAAGVGSTLPPTDAPTTVSLRYRSDTRDDAITLSFGAVTPGFFDALGTPLESGRRFARRDQLAEFGAMILSASAAPFMYPADSDPVGRSSNFAVPTLAVTKDTPIIGVVDDMTYRGLDAPRTGAVYVPWQRRPMGLAHLVVRTTGDPRALVPTLRTLIMQLNPTLPLPDVRTLDDHIAGSIAGRRLQLVPAAAVAALALAVAMVGLFGTLGRAVTERRQELSIRAAVGASPARLVRLVLRSSLAVTIVGLGVGLAAAAGRALSSLLYGVSPYDPVTFAVVTGVVLVAALIASIMPARRAARLDPLIALKGE